MKEAQRREAPVRIEGVRQRLARLAMASRISLGWERLWPRLWLPIAVILTFLALSWFGLWTALPWQGRALGVALFATALLASLWHVARMALPTHRDALSRLDQSLEGGHRPASALEDSLAVGAKDPVSQALWALHVERQSERIAGLSVAAPQPRMANRDRRALRAVPVLAAVTAFFVAGPESDQRLRAAFDWRGPSLPAPATRIDAWIDPPAYTRLPPMLIDFGKLASPQITAPEKSTIVVRIAGKSAMDVAVTGRLDALAEPKPGEGKAADGKAAEGQAAAAPAAKPAPGQAPGVVERRYTLAGNGTLRLTGAGAPGATLSITAIPDRAPEIAFREPPKPVTGPQPGGLSIIYEAKDDYGLASVEATVERAGPPSTGRSLVEAPKQTLSVPSSPTGEEEMKSTVDFSAHPWAGAKVRMTLVARDEAGQEGRSEAVEVVLPQRTFAKPLAKALVEQRRKLVMDVDTRSKVQLAMDALLIEPGLFMKETGVYLGMRMIGERLRQARTDDQLREVAELMWALALQLEDGDLSDAERALRAAQENLQQALERGASEDEIKKLAEDLRRAMDQFMRQLAEQMQRQQQNADPNQMSQLPENFRTVTPRDLQNMLNRIEELSKRGDMAEAQRLMEQLNQMLNNLQMARPGQQDPRQREMNQALSDLDRMTRDQQNLRDETFQQEQQRQNRAQRGQRPGQQQARPGQQGQRQQGQRGQQPGQQPGDQGEDGEEGEGQQGAQGQQGQGGQSLAQRQQQLRDRLQDLQRRMRGMGAPQQGELGEAEGAMGEAGEQLGQGQGEGALDAQGRALEALRKGAQNLAQQMQGQPGEGGEPGEGAFGEPDGQPAGRPSAQQRGREDPLGRPQRQRDWADGRVRVPGADESATQRARRILEELRRRLGDPSRPMEELDYLERLLRRN
ncbi:MAG: TIGR02302 family protein [Bosea sp. (in: a-proteobacteria)]|uniref:TIGR02302 family protein n=1 Tax=Bosea sp. (in: a-proteobacteria) TaxID=1871050 RepID=UPI00273403AB|nr:TIGR02302 family protein [Bosea sp. (in: a-proteobacteria)]MDP3603261.1 TIGR02302 family protein [Bosea sp. (in: a-proteobacteria)]